MKEPRAWTEREGVLRSEPWGTVTCTDQGDEKEPTKETKGEDQRGRRTKTECGILEGNEGSVSWRVINSVSNTADRSCKIWLRSICLAFIINVMSNIFVGFQTLRRLLISLMQF